MRATWTKIVSLGRPRSARAPSKKPPARCSATPLGDATLTADGKNDKLEGNVQNAIGGLKDTLKR
jgi:hypothetical protein